MFDLHHLPNPIPDEKLVHFLRRHPITLVPLILGYFVVLLVPAAIAWYLVYERPDILADVLFFPLILLVGSLLFLFAWLILFQMFMDYYLDVWIVTTRRILNIEQTGVFNRVVSELRLFRVQDVTASVNGFLHTMLNYGEVEIQTAGGKTRFRFEEVPNPMNISKDILELSELDRKEHLDESIEELNVVASDGDEEKK